MRIVQKPWGYEQIWAETDKYLGKILYVKQGHRLSRQYHNVKHETIMVLSGTLRLELGAAGENVIMMVPESSYEILPGTIHRFCAASDDVSILEVSTPEIDDVIRLSDDYIR
jgi:mannose-1-phosphate guanylyltransferase